jgi:hypothetical protein
MFDVRCFRESTLSATKWRSAVLNCQRTNRMNKNPFSTSAQRLT